MMAAGTAAQTNARVLLIEKNPTLGKKLLITGGGRCNVTNAELDTRKLLAKFGSAEQFLFSTFSQWGVQDTLNFFHEHGMDTKIENELRVFPISNTAQSVWDVLTTYMKQGNVTIKTRATVAGFVTSPNQTITAVKLTNGEIIHGKSFILATGGKSRPETGSTGDGFDWLKELGHTVINTAPSLVPLKLSDEWVQKLQGVSLPLVRFTLFENKKAQHLPTGRQAHKGKLLFTHFGISGPGVLNMSHDVQEILEYGTATIMADLLPALDHKQIDTAILESFKGEINKKFKNISSELLPNAVIQTLGELADINPETPCHSVSRESRLKLVQLIKALPLHVSGTLGLDKAIVTSGGIALEEVDFKTMHSRKISNLFVTGDILNISRPSGGFSLQLCWTTGVVAGRNASQ